MNRVKIENMEKAKKHSKLIKLTICSLIFITFAFGNTVAQDTVSSKKDTINFVVSGDIFEDVNSTDAKAAMVLTLKEMMPNFWDFVGKVDAEVVNSVSEIRELLKQNKADVVGLISIDFLENREAMNLEPVFIIERGSNIGDIYLVVTKNNRQINSVSDLNSKKILTYETREGEIVNRWLYVEMRKAGMKNPNAIIDNFTKISKASKRIISVFLEKADACIISKQQYESMCELNPQLEQQLKIVCESPSFLSHVFSRNLSSKKPNIENAGNYALITNTTEQGSKLLKLFKAARVKKFENKYLLALEKMVDNYNKYINE